MITDAINVKCQGQTVTQILDGNGDVLANLSAEVENADQYVKPSGKKTITTNGTHNVSEYAEVEVNVQGGVTPVYQQKEVTPSLVEQIITADAEDGYDALSRVTVHASAIQPTKTVTPGSTEQHITPDDGFIGLSEVIVGAGGGGGVSLATYLGKPTVTIGGSTSTVAGGKISITVQKETKMRTYILLTTDGINRNSDVDMCVFTCSAENNVKTCKWASRGKSTAGELTWYANMPTGWTITDNEDGTVTIESAPTSGLAWWYYNTPARTWHAFRLNDAIGG